MPRSKEELTKLTVVELKTALKELGQAVTGKKEELVDRLFAAEAGAADEEAAPESTAQHEEVVTEVEEPVAALPVDAAPAVDPAADEPVVKAEASKDGKRPRIVFSEEAVKSMPAQITVIHSVELAKPVKTDAEKIKERADRFKDPDVEKAKQRAQRFGVFNADVEREKAVKRAERFGTPNEDLDEERKQKRAARFGIVDPVAKLAARAQKFGVVAQAPKGKTAPKSLTTAPVVPTVSSAEFEAQKKARAARFAS